MTRSKGLWLFACRGMSTSQHSIFVPSKPIAFDSKGKVLIFQSRAELKRLKYMTYVPWPLIAYTAYSLGYNIFVAHKVLKSLMWAGAFAGSIVFHNNVKSNAQTIIDKIYLLESGDKVEIVSQYGESKGYSIKFLRPPNQEELGLFRLAGGE